MKYDLVMFWWSLACINSDIRRIHSFISSSLVFSWNKSLHLDSSFISRPDLARYVPLLSIKNSQHFHNCKIIITAWPASSCCCWSGQLYQTAVAQWLQFKWADLKHAMTPDCLITQLSKAGIPKKNYYCEFYN